jgi:hypothetical protein
MGTGAHPNEVFCISIAAHSGGRFAHVLSCNPSFAYQDLVTRIRINAIPRVKRKHHDETSRNSAGQPLTAAAIWSPL